jgi:hypothetical protein
MHEHEADWWAEFLGLLVDPAHIMFEVVASLVIDVVIVAGLYGIIFKKFILPKLRRDIHREIDQEHGIEH